MSLAEKRVRILASHGVRVGIARVIVRAANDHDLSLSVLLGMCDTESGFANIFGHDAVRNPVKSPPNGTLAVTKTRYREYAHHRDAGEGNQGVGVTQLTDKGLQLRADARGGCWLVSAQVDVAAEVLSSLIKRHGTDRGLASYNAGETGWHNGRAYAAKVRARADVWHDRLANGGAA